MNKNSSKEQIPEKSTKLSYPPLASRVKRRWQSVSGRLQMTCLPLQRFPPNCWNVVAIFFFYFPFFFVFACSAALCRLEGMRGREVPVQKPRGPRAEAAGGRQGTAVRELLHGWGRRHRPSLPTRLYSSEAKQKFPPNTSFIHFALLAFRVFFSVEKHLLNLCL